MASAPSPSATSSRYWATSTRLPRPSILRSTFMSPARRRAISARTLAASPRPTERRSLLGGHHHRRRRRVALLSVERPEVFQEDNALLAHLGEVARDAAVITDKLGAVGQGVLEVGVVNELPHDLSARGREPVGQGLAVF